MISLIRLTNITRLVEKHTNIKFIIGHSEDLLDNAATL